MYKVIQLKHYNNMNEPNISHLKMDLMALTELQKFQFAETTLLNEAPKRVEQMHEMHYPMLSAMVQCKSQQIEAEININY